MRSVTWNDELRVGVSLFDDEHHEMIDLLNDMREQISSNASDVDITEAFKNFVECGVTISRMRKN
jgi:hemerythrin